MARYSVLGVCRGPFKGHLAISYSQGTLEARAFVKGSNGALPSSCELIPTYSLSGQPSFYNVSVPLLSCDIAVELFDGKSGEVLGTETFSALSSKLQSRLLARRNPHLADCLRAHENLEGDPCVLLGVYPNGSETSAWRFSCRFDAALSYELCVKAWGANGAPIDVAPILLEDQTVATARDPKRCTRFVSVSVVLDNAIDNACFEFSLGGDDSNSFFACGYPAWVKGNRSYWSWLGNGGGASKEYASWARLHRCSAREIEARRQSGQLAYTPLISIVTCVFNPQLKFIQECVDSVLGQSYAHWEFVLVNVGDKSNDVSRFLEGLQDPRIAVHNAENVDIASNTNAAIGLCKGDYVAFLDHDDVLEPDALYSYVCALQKDPSIDLFYSDEDHLKDGEVFGPAFKPDADLTKLCSYNYVTHFLMVSRYALEHTDRSPADVAGAQDYDLTLKCFESARSIHHEPRVLYHWREHEGSTAGGSNQKPYAHTAGMIALQRHLDRMGEDAVAADGPLPYTYRVDYRLPEPAPMVSIVIPNKDHADLLRDCVSSIYSFSTYQNFEVVIVENNSCNNETFDMYRDLESRFGVKTVVWTPAELGPDAPGDQGFNYSSLVNYGVSKAQGDYVVLLNNDTRVIEPSWIEKLLGQAMRPGVGIVGAKLVFEDGLVQHAGLFAHGDQNFAHINRNLDANAMGYNHSLGLAQEYSMVTGACQLIPRSVFEELGGYDEALAVGFNDGDFCLRAREAGYSVVYEPRAVLVHREFSSRGRESHDTRLEARLLREKGVMLCKHADYFVQGDPFIDSNLNRFSDWWELS